TDIERPANPLSFTSIFFFAKLLVFDNELAVQLADDGREAFDDLDISADRDVLQRFSLIDEMRRVLRLIDLHAHKPSIDRDNLADFEDRVLGRIEGFHEFTPPLQNRKGQIAAIRL